MHIGVDLGGTNIAVGLVDEKGNIIYKDKIPTGAWRDPREIICDTASFIKKIVNDAGYSIGDIESIGIGSPGTSNNESGSIIYANNINFYHFPVRQEIQKYFSLPVYIGNDANCAALAEAIIGKARGTKDSITITLGTGIGSGIIIDGKVYSGFNSAGGELGHMVIQIDGEECTCGRRGCWERYASVSALIQQTKTAVKSNSDSLLYRIVDGDIDKVGGKTAFDVARKGDAIGLKVVEEYMRYLAIGITNTINIFQPEILLIGGGISKEGEFLLAPLRRHIAKQVYSRDIAQTKIETAELGNDAGIIGAAMLCQI